MPLLIVNKNSKGFTLAETLVMVVIIGILAAITAPSFMRWLQNERVDDALVNLEGALKETQREAIRKSATCGVLVPDGDGQTLTRSATSAASCSLSSRRLPDGVSIISNLQTNPKSIRFSLRGTTTSSATIALSAPDDLGQKRCLVISNPLGITRTGFYDGSINARIDDTNCTSR